MGYCGFVTLEDTLEAAFVVRDSSRRPKDPDATPTFRAYGGLTQGLMTGGTGSAAARDTGVITAASGTPIIVTSASHGLTTGTKVHIAGVGGNTNANGDWTVTVIDANTFSLDSSASSGAYTSGGTWHVAGLYGVSLSVTSANGYETGQTYTILVSFAVGGVAGVETLRFTVV